MKSTERAPAGHDRRGGATPSSGRWGPWLARPAVGLLPLALFTLLAALVLGDWPPLRRLDVAVAERLNDFAHDHPVWTRAMNFWTDAFAPMPLRIAALILVIVLAVRGTRRLAGWVTATMVVGGLLGPLLKLLVGRSRPALPDPVAEAPGLAFPSGHALNAALAAGVLLVVFLSPTGGRLAALRPVTRVAVFGGALLIALVTGFSRIALGVHWTSDVLAGWLLGTAVVATAVALFFRQPRTGRERRGPAPQGSGPVPAPQGSGPTPAPQG